MHHHPQTQIRMRCRRSFWLLPQLLLLVAGVDFLLFFAPLLLFTPLEAAAQFETCVNNFEQLQDSGRSAAKEHAASAHDAARDDALAEQADANALRAKEAHEAVVQEHGSDSELAKKHEAVKTRTAAHAAERRDNATKHADVHAKAHAAGDARRLCSWYDKLYFNKDVALQQQCM